MAPANGDMLCCALIILLILGHFHWISVQSYRIYGSEELLQLRNTVIVPFSDLDNIKLDDFLRILDYRTSSDKQASQPETKKKKRGKRGGYLARMRHRFRKLVRLVIVQMIHSRH